MNRKSATHILSLLAICLGVFPTLATSQDAGSLAARVAKLEAREAIEKLIFAYGRALDTRDFVAFSNLFAEEDGTWDGGMGVASGRDAIFELMDSTIGHASEPVQPRNHHVMTNISIEIDGDQASATTKWIFVVPSEAGEPRWQFLGHYDDTFVRRDGQWFFQLRKAFTDIPIQP